MDIAIIINAIPIVIILFISSTRLSGFTVILALESIALLSICDS